MLSGEMPFQRRALLAASATAGALHTLPAAAQIPAFRQAGALRFFAPNDAPFDRAGRRALAEDVLRHLPDLHGMHAGRDVFLLPPTKVLGVASSAHPRPWQLTVPGGVPIYLPAYFSVDGTIDPAHTRVTVDGHLLAGPPAASATSANASQTPILSLADYKHDAVRVPVGGNIYDHTVCDLIIAPPPPGIYRIEITRDDARDERNRFTLAYELTVQTADALGPLVFREAAADPSAAPRLWAIHQDSRRLIPDAETATLLGAGIVSVRDAPGSTLAAFPEGAPLPALRDGMLLKGPAAPLFRLAKTAAGTHRVRLRSLEEAGPEPIVQQVEGTVLHTIPPELVHDTLLHAGPDIFHAENGALRHVPSWEWIDQRGLKGDDVTRLPERLLLITPRTRAHGLPAGVSWMDASLKSEALATALPYRVFLPPGYHAAEERDRRWPVLYLLHGMSGRWDEWHIILELERMLNQVVTSDPSTQLIVVLPQGGLGYWVDQKGGARWATSVARDLVGHVDLTYRTLAQRDSRAIGGISAGGHGAYQISLTFPDVFGTAGAHSPSLPEEREAPGYFGGAGGYRELDPETLVKSSTLSRPPRFWLDIGDQDRWARRAERLREALREKNWEHEWRLNQAAHEREYWIGQLKNYLAFYLGSFARYGAGSKRA
ncbi:MAG TPA: alpha/beta hydrolase-fold protein [Chloroflexota bacterium]|nr:alpha/beta hydrolase-fold protein [Chloroflexota bacterium]